MPVTTHTWCTCRAAGTCLGCLIDLTVLEQFGTAGLAHLRESQGQAELDKALRGVALLAERNRELVAQNARLLEKIASM